MSPVSTFPDSALSPQEIFGCLANLVKVREIQRDEECFLSRLLLQPLEGVLTLVCIAGSDIHLGILQEHHLSHGENRKVTLIGHPDLARVVSNSWTRTGQDPSSKSRTALTSITTSNENNLSRHVHHIRYSPLFRAHRASSLLGESKLKLIPCRKKDALM